MQLVTDRTKADVLLGTEKGRYGEADLNRVESAVLELYQMATMLDVGKVPAIKTDWRHPEAFAPETWPTKSQMARYLMNVQRLCHAVLLAANLPATMERLTWEDANNIENALQLVYGRIQGIFQTFRFSGEFFSGEEGSL